MSELPESVVANSDRLRRSIADTLKAAAKLAGGSQAVSDRTGIPKRSIDAYTTNETSIPGDRLLLISQALIALNPRTADLLRDLFGFSKGGEAHATGSPERPVEYDDFVTVPLYDIAASAGDGKWIDSAPIKSYLAFRRDWLRTDVLVAPESDTLGLITSAGDSMPLSAPDRAVVMIKRLVEPQRFYEGVYLMVINGLYAIKRVQSLSLGFEGDESTWVVRVSSENPAYSPFEVKMSDATQHENRIVGRVMWHACRVR